MIDQYIPEYVIITPEIGEILRQYRVSKNVQAKEIAESLSKSAAYITKLEKGILKKIKSESFLIICDTISGDHEGVLGFIQKTKEIVHTRKKSERFSKESELSIRNVYDCILPFEVYKEYVQYVNNYLSKYNLSEDLLITTMNQNKDIFNDPDYNSLPNNQWVAHPVQQYGDDSITYTMKISITSDYIGSILNGSRKTAPRFVLESIMHSAFQITNDYSSLMTLDSVLGKYGYSSFCFIYSNSITPDNISDINEFDSDVKSIILDIMSSFKVISYKYPQHGIPGFEKLSKNLVDDLGFTYAYLNTDLTPLKEKSRNQKQEFLDELRALVKRYSKKESDIDLFD